MKAILFSLATLSTATLISCETTNSDNRYPVTFYLTDAPTAEFQSVNVEITSIMYSANGVNWESLNIKPTIIDLLQFNNGQDTLMSELMLKSEERVNQIRLVLGGNNSVITVSGETFPLKTPSAQTSGIKMLIQNGATQIEGPYSVVMDFDASRSVVNTGNDGYILKPVIRAFIQQNSATLAGNIIPVDQAYWVYVISPTGETISTISNIQQQNYFQLRGLSKGKYDLYVKTLSTSEIVYVQTGITISDVSNQNVGIINVPHVSEF